jgi:hypothetical protein
MKQSLFFFACLVALVTCSTPAVQQDKTYNWLLDMFVLSFDTVIITVLTPIWFFLSFFAGCQRCYIEMVDKVMTTIPLSYRYV